MIRFYIALWAAKLVDAILTLRGDRQNDRAGYIANRLCPDFMARVTKPKLVVAITGTNGKTTTSTLVCNMLRSKGMKVSFNEWGANINAGYSINLLRCVDIFNRCRVDASVLEADEKSTCEGVPMIRPDYMVVTNICKDSLRRNGHPEYIFDRINRAFAALGGRTVAILNANDPISSELARNTGARRVFFGMDDIHADPLENRVKDVAVCPRCGGEIRYHYRHYRHIGDFYCTDCDFATPAMDYRASGVDLDKGTITVAERDGAATYPLMSDTVFYAFNTLSAVALFRELGYSRQEIADFLATQKVPKIRESVVEYDGIRYYAYAAKGQNISAASTVFEHLAKDPSVKELVFSLDEVQDANHPPETLSWLYETDYEFLNVPQIRKIIVGGHMCHAHRLRLLLAGVPEEKIVCVENEADVPQYVDTEGIDRVYVLYEIDFVTKGQQIRDAIVERAREVKGK